LPSAADPAPAVAQDAGLLDDAAPVSKPRAVDPGPAPNAPPAKPVVPQTKAPPRALDMSRLEVRTGQKSHDPPKAEAVSPMAPPADLTAVVTGPNPSKEMLNTAVESAIRTARSLPWNATVTWRPKDEKFVLPALTPGTKLTVPVVYKVNGGSELSPADVTIDNRSIPAARETVTFFSNNPENLKQQQLLYSADLKAGQASRLVYHHQNQASSTLEFIARVVNTTGKAAAVHVIPGPTAANINTFFVGFKSAETFWQNLSSGTGYVLRIPAGGQAWLIGQDLQPGYTASGYYKLTNLADSALRIETLAVQPGVEPPKGPWPKREGATGVYPLPYMDTSHEFEANRGRADWLILRLGEEAPGSHTDDSVHYGCYGVTHTYTVQIRNTKDQPALVYVVLRGSAGEVKGQFYIDDQYIATALVPGGEEQLLTQIPVKPLATRTVKIKAIALNGGFYPASIIFRETPEP
jgi:hypothetical protein